MIERTKKWLIEKSVFIEISAVFILLFTICILSVLLFLKSEQNEKEWQSSNALGISEHLETLDQDEDRDQSELSASNASQEKSYVDIKGAVNYPDVYEVTADMRVADVVELAGGFLPEADLTAVNLSMRLTDQMMIFIPKEGEERLESGQLTAIPDTLNEEEKKVNINTAESDILQTLPSIGEKKAEVIIDYRQENGSFQTIEEIKKVSGIGEKTFEGLKDLITVGD